MCNSNLLPAEHKAAASILRTLTKESTEPKIDLTKLLAHPEVLFSVTCETCLLTSSHVGLSSIASITLNIFVMPFRRKGDT